MPDKYDEAIEYLAKNWDNHNHIYEIWEEPGAHFSGCLFDFAGDPRVLTVGCLTQIRQGCAHAATPELTTEIKADERLPASEFAIELEHLPVFAEWQRKIDAMGVR